MSYSLWFCGSWFSYMNSLTLPSMPNYLPLFLFMASETLRPQRMLICPPCFLKRMYALFPSFKQWDMLSLPYVPLGSYYAAMFLVWMIVYGQMYVCVFLSIYIWMAGGWLYGLVHCSVILLAKKIQNMASSIEVIVSFNFWSLDFSCSFANLSLFLI